MLRNFDVLARTGHRQLARIAGPVFCGLALLALSACMAEPQGKHSWPMHTIDDTYRGADGVDSADIDTDGDMGLIEVWEESGRVILYENPGPSQVFGDWRRTDVVVGVDVSKIEDARFADFDGDTKIDAIVSATENGNEKANIHWLEGSANIFESDSWESISVAPAMRRSFMKAAIGQISGVGANDIVAGSKADRAADDGPAQLLWYQSPKVRSTPIPICGQDTSLPISTG